MGWKAILFIYILGGLTLPPFLITGLLYLFFVILPKRIDVSDDLKDDDLSEFAMDEYQSLKLTELQEKETTGVKTFRVGWLTVTREYHPFISNASDKQLDNKNTENKSAYTSLYKLVKNTAIKNAQNTETEHEPTPKTNQAVSKAIRRKNRYYGVLRHGNLFLYKDELKKDLQHVIVLSNNVVTVWPRNLTDGELFSKKSAICILKKKSRRGSDAPPKSSSASLSQFDEDSTLDILEKGGLPPKNMGFFVYPDTNYEKEDWYFDLIKATKREDFVATGGEFDKIEPSIYANPLHFKTADIISLIQTLHSSEGQLQTRWLNAIIGRLFLSFQNTEYFENIVKSRIMKKLEKINKPGFLDEFQIKKIDVGESAPFISYPKLVELNPDGSTKISLQFSYRGKLSLQVSTTANINLGSAFKTREVSLLLAVTLNRLEGPLLLSIKSPPSSRFWYTFEENPDIDLTVEPVVSQRQISYSMINKVIENKLINAVKESLVYPSWDDLTFFNTSGEFYRGGIWDTEKRPDTNTFAVDEAEKEQFIQDYGIDEEELIVTSETATGNDYAISEDSSVRSRDLNTLKSKDSISNIRRKTEPTIDTSNDQFLSNGSFVAKDMRSPNLNESNSRSSTMQILSEEASAGKKTISNGIKKIGKWYAEKNKSVPAKDSNYKPPEMISQRRTASVSSDNQSKSLKRDSSTDLKSISAETKSISSNEPTPTTSASSSHHKTAPKAHSFPAEYMYGLDTEHPDEGTTSKNFQPNKIPEMKSPYMSNTTSFTPLEPTEASVSSKLVFPKRKPVELDSADTIVQQGTDPILEIENSPKSAPPDLPTRQNASKLSPPALPTRKAPPKSAESNEGNEGGEPDKPKVSIEPPSLPPRLSSVSSPIDVDDEKIAGEFLEKSNELNEK